MSNQNRGGFGGRPQKRHRGSGSKSRGNSAAGSAHNDVNWRQEGGARSDSNWRQEFSESSHHNGRNTHQGPQRQNGGNNHFDRNCNKKNENSTLHGSRQNLSNTHDSRSSNNQRRERSMGFKFIEDLLKKDAEEAIMDLNKNYNGFLMTLNKQDLTGDFIVLIVQLLEKICSATFDAVKSKLLKAAFDSNFSKKLLQYITTLCLQEEHEKKKNRYFWNNQDGFWYSLLESFQYLISTSPSYASQVLPKLVRAVNMAVMNIEQMLSIHISDEIKNSFKEMSEKLELLVKDFEKKKEEMVVERSYQEEEPPNDFRDINIYPDPQELTDRHFNFLRKNVITGSYKSTYDYLDIQFRLLREDFVAPLREGICSFLSEEKKRLQNIRIYKNVHFLNTEFVNNQNCYRISFQTPGKKISFKYENSRRFMFGALLCFTQDNFRTVIFGKVVDRKLELLKEGYLIVGFDTDHDIKIDCEIPYMMVECNVYFEPYFHVLTVLKNFNFNNFPMEKYIIQVNNTPQPPKYLTPFTTYTVNNFSFTPLNWPVNHRFFNLNDSQNEAFRAALTQEFAVIQGPPGTGKTFLGLKIAETLLNNKDAWYKRTPMLVICYTNHALDQFLEGLLHVAGDKILRIGGQSKNEKLEQFNIRKKNRKEGGSVAHARWELRNCLAELRKIGGLIAEINQFDSILDLCCFQKIAPEIPWLGYVTHAQQISWLFSTTTSRSSAQRGFEDMQQIVNEINLQIKKEDDSDIEDEDMQDYDDVYDDVFEGIQHTKYATLIGLKAIDSERKNLEKQLTYLEKDLELPELERYERIDQVRFELDQCRAKANILQEMLERGRTKEFIKIENFTDYAYDMNRLAFEDRWNLYFSLLLKYYENLHRKQERLNAMFQRLYREYTELRDMEDVHVMKDVLVVGMTTTGAARLRSSLQALRSPIVIVEEAAEVLEAHIVTSLTPSCQHLILIGDHQQLKPSTAHFTIEKKYYLGVSLFERMVHNGIQCYTLDVQHRMRPEISALITPRIYPNLKNHESVLERPDVLGVEKPVYFIDHRVHEKACEDESKKNPHEASLLISLARHLVLNGHKPEEITILAAYLGQFYEMQREKKKQKLLLQDVRVTVLDNYQGEESEIILLSLVRSNSEKRIGFLDLENRVCVALSRARTGFYIVGNMNHLVDSNKNDIWKCVKESLENNQMIGPHLTLKCQIHPYNLTLVKCADDFAEISEGGCKEFCNRMLACGHKCPSRCHVMNRDHTEFKCKERCGRKLCDTNENHICKKKCFEECGPCTYPVERNLDCSHTVVMECSEDPAEYRCKIPVETHLPCGHIADKPCHVDPEKFTCPHPCDTKVEPCGHACIRRCHVRDDPDHLEYKCRKQCEKYGAGCLEKSADHICKMRCYEECSRCEIPVKRTRSCTHVHIIQCSFNIEDVECTKPCKKRLDCNHYCKNKCNEPCGPCKVMVEKSVPECNHRIKIKCCDIPSRKLCPQKCPLKLPCGHSCMEKCSDTCTQQCKEMVDCNFKSPCGHVVTRIHCYLKSAVTENDRRLLQYCTTPCSELLSCEHPCLGSCSECYQGRMHKKCGEECGALHICSHPCTTPCRKACRPCTERCLYRCKHSKCKRVCGEPCTPCSEQCGRHCFHQRCKNRCGQICSVGPCEEPCPRTLRCGHPCTGFCSEPCPKICFECDKDEVETIFMTFATEDEENARLVQLADCGHIVENSGMNRYLGQDSEEIKMKVCPLCKTPIITTKRYSDYVKKSLDDIQQVKLKLYGSEKENLAKRNELLRKIRMLETKLPLILKDVIPLSAVKQRLETKAQGRRQPLSAMDLSSLESKYQILENIYNILAKSKFIGEDIWLENVRFICNSMLATVDEIRDQEIADITCELKRLSRLAQFGSIRHLCGNSGLTTEMKHLSTDCEHKLNDFRKFTDEADTEVAELMKKLDTLLPKHASISPAEIQQVVSAMGTALGHWYKCPNGHNYYIGECGGAMQRAKCNECGATIGGEQHTLVSGNTHSRIDGSTYAAWSEQANMINYDLRNLGIDEFPRRNMFGFRRFL